MITKAELLKCSIEMFTEIGSKHVTLDELANELGISKKTIYTFYKNKHDLVTASLECILGDFKKDINTIISENSNDPVLSVILIYEKGFEYLKYFKPSFLFGLEKYYPKASTKFYDFIEDFSSNIVYRLLKQAQENGSVKKNINLELLVKIYFFRMDNIVFKENDLFNLYSKEEIFKYLIVYNIKGIITDSYTNCYFQENTVSH